MKDLFEIFVVFCKIGAFTFGGGYAMLPILQKDVEQKYQWATAEEILDYYAISQCLPGIIAVNCALLIGYKKKGASGAIVALLGVILPSIIIILIIAMFIQNFIHLEAVTHAFNGIRVAVTALVIQAAIKMWKSGVVDKTGVIIFSAAAAAFTFLSISPIIPIISGAVCGIIIKERKI